MKTVREKFELLAAALDEKTRRLWAASEGRPLGYGGITCVAEATTIHRATAARS